MPILIDGKATSAKIKAGLREQCASAEQQYGRKPGLAVIIVGEDPASKTYVKNKGIACEACGFYSQTYALPAETTMEQLLELIDTLNGQDTIDGILVQLPLPRHLDAQKVIAAIRTDKDVDCFSYENVGRVTTGLPRFLPCTPAGVMALLKEYNIDPSGKECVVLGRSNIVGKPMALLLLAANGTVTVCHSRTADLAAVCRRADILVSAIGRAKMITADMVKDGAVVIDVGMNRDENGRLCGDVDFENVAPKTSAITPVPGGVGPMTIAMLMQNTYTSFCSHVQK